MNRPVGVTFLAFLSSFMAILMALAALQWLGLTPLEWVALPIILNSLVLLYIMLPGVRQAFGQEKSN